MSGTASFSTTLRKLSLLFFRDVLLESVIQAYQDANVPSGRAWGEILRKVNAYTDMILVRLLETFRTMENSNL